MTKVTLLLWRTVLLIIAAVLIWRVLATGLAAHYALRLQAGDAEALQQVLTWQPHHPRGLYEQAIRVAEEDTGAALGLLAQAYAANPTAPRPLLAVAALYRANGRTDDADALVRIADELAPVNPSIQQQIALYWDQRGEAATALQHLSRAMAADRRVQRENLPVILRLAEEPSLRPLLEPIALEDPKWWPTFFRYATRRADNTDVVRYLMELRRRMGTEEITEEEQTAYQNRLLRDGYPSEAYLAWLNMLEPKAREELGLLFNGGFELPLSDTGFGWGARGHKQLDIRPLRTLGGTGAQSLMVRFSNFDQRFHHVGQRLLLQPGTYRLTGAARVDGLKTEGGVRWRLACRGESRDVLGESKVFLGRAEWSDFSFDFEVPDAGCETQDLRLVSAGRHSFELDIDGALWFDNLRIERTEGLDAAARADALQDP